jgi:Family of unknown function (DUF5329)
MQPVSKGHEMYRIEHLVYVCLFAMLWLPSADAASTDDALLRTINHLLTYVEQSNCVFIRNGNEYNSKEAAKHIKTKYDSLMFGIKTPEEFIELAASKSMLSGQPYFVRCVDHSPVPSADWLREELSNYGMALHDSLLIK